MKLAGCAPNAPIKIHLPPRPFTPQPTLFRGAARSGGSELGLLFGSAFGDVQDQGRSAVAGEGEGGGGGGAGTILV